MKAEPKSYLLGLKNKAPVRVKNDTPERSFILWLCENSPDFLASVPNSLPGRFPFPPSVSGPRQSCNRPVFVRCDPGVSLF